MTKEVSELIQITLHQLIKNDDPQLSKIANQLAKDLTNLIAKRNNEIILEANHGTRYNRL